MRLWQWLGPLVASSVCVSLALAQDQPAATPHRPAAAAPRREPCEPCEQRVQPPHRGRVALAGAGVEWPVCHPGDPLCSDVASFDLGVAVAQLREGLSGFERCHAHGLARNPRAKGQVAFKLRLAEDKQQARATSVEVEEQGRVDDTTLSCFENRLRALRFDPGASGAILRMSLLLK